MARQQKDAPAAVSLEVASNNLSDEAQTQMAQRAGATAEVSFTTTTDRLLEGAYMNSRATEAQRFALEQMQRQAMAAVPGQAVAARTPAEIGAAVAMRRQLRQQQRQAADQDRPVSSASESVTTSAAKFIIDLPLATLGGLGDAWTELATVMNELVPLDALAEGAGLTKVGTGEILQVPEQRTAGGQMVRTLVNFIGPMSKITKGLQGARFITKLKGGKQIVAPAIAGAITDIAFMEAQEQRLSDYLAEVPWAGAATEFLRVGADETFWEKKILQGIEGAALGLGVDVTRVLVGQTVSALRAMKAIRKVKTERGKVMTEAELKAAIEKEAAEAAQEQLGSLAMGRADDDLLRFDPPEKTLKTAQDIRDVAQSPIRPRGKLGVAEIAGRPVINFTTIRTPNDIEAVLSAMTQHYRRTVVKAKGPRVSAEEVKALAEDIGLADILKLDPKRFSKVELVAMKEFYVASGEKLLQVAEVAAQFPTATNLMAMRKMMSIHQLMLGRFTEASSEAGRALQALSIPAGLGVREQLKQFDEILENFGGLQVGKELAEKIVMAAKFGSTDALNEITKRGLWARSRDAVLEAWVLGLVSGPVTQSRNLAGNTMFFFQNVLERRIAGAVAGSGIDRREAAAFIVGSMHSLRAAFQNMGKAFWNGTSGYGLGKIELPRRKAISAEALEINGAWGAMADMTGEVFRVFGRMLVAGDEFFKTMNYNGEKAAQAVRLHAGKTGAEFDDAVARELLNPSEEIRIAARNAAHYGTFTMRGKSGKIMDMAQQFTAAYPAARFLLPFITTPGNIFKAGFARTPLALAMGDTFWAEVRAGGPRKAMAITRMATGSAMMALWSDMTMRGLITGRGPLNTRERELLRLGGKGGCGDKRWQPYSVCIPGKGWVGYRGLEPIGMMMGMSADITEAFMQREQWKSSADPDEAARSDEILGAALQAVGQSMTSQTFMRGASEFFTMMGNPELYSTRWVQRLASTFTAPRLLAQIERIKDPTIRKVYGLVDAFSKDVPWWGPNRLFPLRDLFGNEVMTAGAWGSEWISPFYKEDRDMIPAAREILDQRAFVGKPGFIQGFMDEFTGQTVTLDLEKHPALFDAYMRLHRDFRSENYDELPLVEYLELVFAGQHDDSEDYLTRPEGDTDGIEDKGKFIRGVFSDYRGEIKEAMLFMQGDEFDTLRELVQRIGQEQALRVERAEGF